MYESADAKCPYYRRHDKEKIWCESGKIILPSFSAVRKEMAVFCCADWKKCPRAKELNRAYEEREKK